MRAHGSTNSVQPLIIGHRGASAVAPENTLAAFSRALADGADGLELDVHLARDGVPVVVHDSNLRRTGLCMGAVAEMTSKELSEVDAGSWFNRMKPRFARPEYSHERVPTFAEVLSFVNQNSMPASRPILYVELKGGRAVVSRELVESSINLVRQHGVCAEVRIISFDLKAVALAKQIDPAVRTGALFAPKAGRFAMIGNRMLASAQDCGAEEILLHRLLATRRLIELFLENNLSPVVWTVSHPAWLRRATTWGIRALITNNPARLKLIAR